MLEQTKYNRKKNFVRDYLIFKMYVDVGVTFFFIIQIKSYLTICTRYYQK